MRAIHFAAGVLAVAAVSCGDVYESSYETAAAARKAGIVDRGWVPEALPPSATEIRERHKIDTNEVAGSFRFAGDDAEALCALERVPAEQIERVVAPRRPPDWWPGILRGQLREADLAKAGLELFKAGEKDFVFAINWDNGQCFFWLQRSAW